MISQNKARSFCCEDISLIENYDKAVSDKERMWDCHHRGEILPCGRFSREELKKHGLYYKVPACQLIFMLTSEHRRLHRKGVPMSEEQKRAISETKRGSHLSKETRQRMSASRLGIKLSKKTRMKIAKAKMGDKNPNFGKSLSEETRRKISESKKLYWKNKRAVA